MWDQAALTSHLEGVDAAEVVMTFPQIEAVIGRLPDSARKHNAWWANSVRSRPHSRSWLDAGFLATPQFVEGRVRFRRGVPSAPGSRKQESLLVTIPSADLDELPPTEAEPYRGEIAYAWHEAGSVLLDSRGRVDIPNLGAGPGVYRFTLFEPGGEICSHYVGESENLFRRLYGYRNPGSGQTTNLRINRTLRELLEIEGSVRLAVVFEATLGEERLDMAHKPARLLVESSALLHLAAKGAVVENLRTGS